MRYLLKKMYALLLMACVTVTGISCGKSTDASYIVYYMNNSATKLVEKEMSIDEKLSGYDLMTTLMEFMNTKQKQDNCNVIKTDGIVIEKQEIVDGIANIYFSKEYNDLDNSREVLLRSGIVKMLSQIEEVSYVRFFVDGKDAAHQDGSIIGLMALSDFVDDSNEAIGSVEWKDVDLYYANKLGDKLVKKEVTVAYNKNVSLEKLVVEKLIKGPSDTTVSATLPSDIKLLSISVSNGLCYVNLSASFLTEMVNVSNEIPVYSIVNSLCALDTVDSVKIMINGDSSKTYRESISLDNTFIYNQSLIGQ